MQKGGYNSLATTCHLLIPEVDAFPTAPSSGLLPATAGYGSGSFLQWMPEALRKGSFADGS